MRFLPGTADGSGHRCPSLVPGTKIFPDSCSTKKMQFKHQQCCLAPICQGKGALEEGRSVCRRARQSPGRRVAVPAPSTRGPSLPAQAVQGRSLLWVTHLGFACGRHISESSASYGSWCLVIMRIGSLCLSQGLGFSFPVQKAKSHQPACEQASHAKATEQRQGKW